MPERFVNVFMIVGVSFFVYSIGRIITLILLHSYDHKWPSIISFFLMLLSGLCYILGFSASFPSWIINSFFNDRLKRMVDADARQNERIILREQMEAEIDMRTQSAVKSAVDKNSDELFDLFYERIDEERAQERAIVMRDILQNYTLVPKASTASDPPSTNPES